MIENFERPRIILPETKNDKIVNLVSIFLLVCLWVFSIWIYINAPEKVPMHFNGSGKVDGYGSKVSILLLPMIGTVMFGFLKYISIKPYLFNYPFKLTAENYERAYSNATSILFLAKFFVIVLFCIIQFMVYKAIHKESNYYSNIALIITLAAVVIAPIVLAIKTIRNK